MFGIGLPELILIMAVGLIVVGPEKLPELAKSLGKGIVELKKAASGLKESLNEEDEDAPAWEEKELDKHPDKLLEAYKDLPEDALAEKFEEITPPGAVAKSETTPATEKITQQDPPLETDTEETEDKSDT